MVPFTREDGAGNSTSSGSPGCRLIPAHRARPPLLISVSRPGTKTLDSPSRSTTRTCRSTGFRGQRRVLTGEGAIQRVELRCGLMCSFQYGADSERVGDYGSGCTTYHHKVVEARRPRPAGR